MKLFEELEARGFIENKTSDEIPGILAGEKVACYDGFDPTGDSLHVGNLVGIMTLAHYQRHGHTPIVLMGGATGMIGDPSGKSKERVLLTADIIERNLRCQKAQFARFLEFDGGGARLVNNADWFAGISFIDFLRDVGKHFRLGEMLAKESVKGRMQSEVGISYTEFSYMLLQSYDFLHLFDEMGCTFQVGGGDQWGNITAGIDLIRKLRGKSAYGHVSPLITGPGGEKLGKTAEGENVWLDPEKTSPYRFYQYWFNQPDSDVVRMLRLFTFLPLDEIAALEEATLGAPHERAAQKRLAGEVTTIVHGTGGCEAAIRASEAVFGGEVEGLDRKTLEDIFAEVPSATLPRGRVDGGFNIVELLVESGATKGKGAARRLIDQGGIYLNNRRVESADRAVGPADLLPGDTLLLRQGRRNYRLVRFE